MRLYDSVNRIELRQKTLCHAILASRFIVEHIIVGIYVCDVALRVLEVIVIELNIYATLLEKFRNVPGNFWAATMTNFYQ